MDYVIAVDLGGTQLRTALLAADGTFFAHECTLTLVVDGPHAVIQRMLVLITQVRTALPDDGHLLGIGIAAPGPLDPATGVIFSPPNMPGWEAFPLRELVAQATGLPVVIGNDANLAALAEWHFGAGKGTRNLIYVTVSTGIGGGVIIDERLLLGRMSAGAELGFLILDAEQGTVWENLASGTALGRAAARALPEHPNSLLHQLATPETVTAAHVAQAWASGDPLAVWLWEREAHLLGLGFASLLHIFSPEIILVGGSVLLHNPALLARARENAYRHVMAPLYREVPIKPAQLGERVCLLGAATLALDAFATPCEEGQHALR